MVVNIHKKRELVSRILGVGVNRVRFEPDKLDDVADSITRENIRALVNNGSIWTSKVRGTSRGRTRTKLQTKKKHGTGPGSKKGKKTARVGKKEIYVIKIRSMRRHLKILKVRKDLTNDQFWTLYKKVNGAQVRSLSHLRELVKSIRTH